VIKQDTKSAAEFYGGKVDELATNIKDLEGIVQNKTNSLRVVEEGEFGFLRGCTSNHFVLT